MYLQAGALIAEKYQIENLLGEGGMGSVYAATNRMTNRTVALKLLRPELSLNAQYVERLMREARLAGRLDHPNIVNVFDAGHFSGSLYLVMELLRGESFDAWLRRGPHPHAACIALLMPALRGVAAAHAAGVIHRDLKPDNIFLCTDREGFISQTKVLDFGIAKELSSGIDADRSLTSPGALIGTIHYMGPEQVRAAHSVDVRCDVYALGVILYRALGGELPFKSESLGDLIIEIAEGNAEPLSRRRPDLPVPLCQAVMRAMARDPAARFQSVESLARALEPYSAGVRFEQSREYLSKETPTLLGAPPTQASPGVSARGHTPVTSDPVEATPAPASRRIPVLAWAPLVAVSMLALVLWFVWSRRVDPVEAAPARDPGAGASVVPVVPPAPEVRTSVSAPELSAAPDQDLSATPANERKPAPLVREPGKKPPPDPKRGAPGPSSAPAVSSAPAAKRPPPRPAYEDNPYLRH
jgi:eukaryotic-like serine/threonine-protein kinase